MSRTYFLEIPIYRVSPKRYMQEVEDEKLEFYTNMYNSHNLTKERSLSLFRTSRNEWKYNEIIGGLGFWYDGLIKVDLYFTPRRISKSLKNKDIKCIGKIHELNVGYKSNLEIYEVINGYLDELQQKRFQKYWIYRDSFLKLGRFMDYSSLLKDIK